MPDAVHLVRYADDVAAIIEAQNVEEAKRYVNQVVIRTKSWLEDRAHKLATEKKELILLTKKHMPLEIDITTCDTLLVMLKVVNYLGIPLEPRSTFWVQL